MDYVSELLTSRGILHKSDKPIPQTLVDALTQTYELLYPIYTDQFTGKHVLHLMDLCGTAPPNTLGKRNHVFLPEHIPQLKSNIQSLSRDKFLKIINLNLEEFVSLVLKNGDPRIEPLIRKGLENNFELTRIINTLENTILMTIHKSKGKEADTVIIVDKATYYEREGREDSEEERRVWYVAITRAKKRLVILSLDIEHTQYLGMDQDEDTEEDK